MPVAIEYLFLAGGTLLLLSIIASKVSAKIGVPALLIFLAIGMLAGSDGLGGIHFDNAWLAQSLGIVALIFILFSGGLETQWSDIKPIFWKGLSLSTLGVLISAGLVGCFATVYLKFSWLEGLLLGAIISSTDAAAVFSILRSKGGGLKGQLQPLLEFESGSNDPMAVFLTIGLIRLLTDSSATPIQLVPLFIMQMGLGSVMGYVLGKFSVKLLNLLSLEFEGLYPVLTLSLISLIYGITASLGGSGFLAVYIAGIVFGNSHFIHKRSLIRFQDGLAWLWQIIMFITLGLLVYPTRLIAIADKGLIAAAFLIFVARPLSVFISLAFAKMSIREKLMLSWIGLRGSVPIILATFPLLAKIPKADIFFNLVFFIVLTSTLLQGTSLSKVAKLFSVDEPLKKHKFHSVEFENIEDRDNKLVEFIIPYHSALIGKRIFDLRLPYNSPIMLICRHERFIVPHGRIQIQAGDVLLILVNESTSTEVSKILLS